MSGKGDTPRPRQISDAEYEARWRATFQGKVETYRCGCFVTGTGEQCILESDHRGPHRFRSDEPNEYPPAWRLGEDAL